MKSLIYTALSALRPRLTRGASVLMYHSVAVGTDYFSAVAPEVFERHMAWLASEREVIPLAEAIAHPRPAVALSFDDGYEDNFTAAFPVLKRHGFHATIFVVMSRVGQPGYLQKGQIREMHESGLVSFMPHSRTHPDLTTLTDVRLREEVAGSKADLEALIREVDPAYAADIFAYPKGTADARVVAAVREAGYAAAVGVRPGLLTAASDPHMIERNSVDRTTTHARFRMEASDAIVAYERLKGLFIS